MEFIRCQYPGFIGDFQTDVNDALINSWGQKRSDYTNKCEQILCEITGRKYCLMLSHGTSALITAFKSLPLKKGEMVGVPSFTWVSTASAIIHAGGIPVFLDIDENSFTLGTKAISQIEKFSLKIVALVQLCGEMADPLFIEYCKNNSIKIIEDATHVLGGASSNLVANEKYIGGKTGIASCFSFQATKTATAGQGGALLTDDDELIQNARLYSHHGIDKSATKQFYWSSKLGDNFTISDFQCALIYSQIKQIDKLRKLRRELYLSYIREYDSLLPNEYTIRPYFDDELNIPYLPLISIKSSKDANNGNIKELCLNAEWIEKYNIELRPSVYPLHLMEPFRDYFERNTTDLTNTITISNTTLILPFGNRFPNDLFKEVLVRLENVLRDARLEFKKSK